MVRGLANPHYAGGVATTTRQAQVLPYYVVPGLRSIILLVTGLVITFTPGHSAQFGIVALGILGLVSAVGLGLVSLGLSNTKTGRGLHLWQALVSLVVGALALALYEAGMIFLLWAIVFWALLIGVAEVFFGARLARGDDVKRRRSQDRAHKLRQDIGQQLRRREAPADGQPDRDGRVEMPARDAADRIGHRHHGQPEGQGHAQKADPDLGEGGGQHGTAAAAKDQPECAERLGR